MKTALLTILATAACALAFDPVADWERAFIAQQEWAHDNSSVKLIGFKR